MSTALVLYSNSKSFNGNLRLEHGLKGAVNGDPDLRSHEFRVVV